MQVFRSNLYQKTSQEHTLYHSKKCTDNWAKNNVRLSRLKKLPTLRLQMFKRLLSKYFILPSNFKQIKLWQKMSSLDTFFSGMIPEDHKRKVRREKMTRWSYVTPPQRHGDLWQHHQNQQSIYRTEKIGGPPLIQGGRCSSPFLRSLHHHQHHQCFSLTFLVA